jgi:hypothetical protein
LRYWSDIDLQEDVLHTSEKKFLREIQKKVKETDDIPGLYFVDFKMGVFRGSSVHFTKNEVLKGEKETELKKGPITMAELLLTKSIIKLDISVFLKKEKRFVDFSINYYFLNNGVNTAPEFTQELSTIFKSDFNKKVEDGDYIKALKRLYRLTDVRENHKIGRKLEHFLNSPTGRADNIKNMLKTLKTTVELDDFYSWDLYMDEVDMLESIFKGDKMKGVSEKMNSIKKIKNKESISKGLEKVIDAMDGVIQPKAKNFLTNIPGLADFLLTVD